MGPGVAADAEVTRDFASSNLRENALVDGHGECGYFFFDSKGLADFVEVLVTFVRAHEATIDRDDTSGSRDLEL